MNTESIDLEHDVTVPASPDVAFRRFTERFGDWWPQEYTWSRKRLGRIGIEPEVGGRCTETSVDGFTLDFGLVLSVDPPKGLVFAWCIGPTRIPVPNPNDASVVSVGFTAKGADTTMVTLRHSNFDRHGEGGHEYRNDMAGEYGWPCILKAYVDSFDP